jgi:HEAT repeat protein
VTAQPMAPAQRDESDLVAQWRPGVFIRFVMSCVSLLATVASVGIALLRQSNEAHQLQRLLQHINALKLFDFSLDHPLFMASITIIPLAIFGIAYQLLRLTLLIFGWRRYLGRLTRELEARVPVRAPLAILSYIPSVRSARAGSSSVSQREPLSHALAIYPRLILTGDDGSGKTVALWRHALDIARGASIRRIIGGKQVVPIIVPLVAYAQAEPASDGLRVNYLANILRQYKAHMLAVQLPMLLRRGRVTILFDGLDEVPEGQMKTIVRELNQGLRQKYRNTRVVLTCRAAPLNEMAGYLPLLKHLPHATLLPIEPDEIRQIIRRAGRMNKLGTASAEIVLGEMDQHALWAIYSRPATLAMLIDLVSAGQPIPHVRAHLLKEYSALLFARAGIADDRLIRTQHALGYLALGYRLTGITEIGGAQAWNERDAVKGLLADSTVTLVRTLGTNTRPLEYNEEQIVEAVDLGCMAGVLERRNVDVGLRFRHTLLQYIAAADYLDANDSGLGRISPTLLRSEWTETVILWGGLTRDPVGLAERMTRLAKTGAGAAATALLGNLAQGEPMALALALTMGVIGLTPSATNIGGNVPKKQHDINEHAVRDLFDHVLRYGENDTDADRERRRSLTKALRICENASAGELTPSLARLVRTQGVNRLLRAQAVQVLGLLASPASLSELTNMLLETDTIVRESLQRGFHLAGEEAVEPLLRLLATYPATETIHRRALDALIAVDGPAIPVVLDQIHKGDATARAVAAETLGALHDRRALEPLLAALKETDPQLRMTAARALGRLGDLKAQPALLSLLQSPSDELRIAAAEALGLLRSEKALKPLLKLLEDRQPKVRAAAAEALGHIGDSRALEPLRRHLSDRDAWAQAAAATALRALGQRA